MAIKANISSGYRRKLWIIGLFVTAFGLWASYDVFIKYPPEYKQFQAYRQFIEDGNLADWPEHAKQAGWPEEEPKRRTMGDFYFNGAIVAIMLPAGLLVLLSAATAGRRWVQADDSGIKNYKGQHAPYDRIVELNEKRWEDKGIAVVIYNDDQGKPGRLVLDEFNYEAQPIRDIFTKVKELLASRNGGEPAKTEDSPSAQA